MIRANKMIPEGANLILTVHDELVTVTPTELAEETVSQIRLAMEGINALNVPLLADITTVKRWGEAK
jgi:DNA polymerase I-like protein with 3'-5' exonuclease and polymerase domains